MQSAKPTFELFAMPLPGLRHNRVDNFEEGQVDGSVPSHVDSVRE